MCVWKAEGGKGFRLFLLGFFRLFLALLGIFGGIEKESGEVDAIRALQHHRRFCRPLLPGSPGGLLLSLLSLGLGSEGALGHILVILVLFRVSGLVY